MIRTHDHLISGNLERSGDRFLIKRRANKKLISAAEYSEPIMSYQRFWPDIFFWRHIGSIPLKEERLAVVESKFRTDVAEAFASGRTSEENFK